MWIIFSMLLVLWVLSVEFYLPVLFILALFAGMLITAGLAMMPAGELE